MMSFSDLPDPDKGRKIFEDAYGPERGPKRFRAVLRVLIPLAIIAVLGGLGLGDWKLLKTTYSEVTGWFSPPSTSHQAGQVPSSSADCIINGSTNYGKIEQTCK
jgi:hypothetical protein